MVFYQVASPGLRYLYQVKWQNVWESAWCLHKLGCREKIKHCSEDWKKFCPLNPKILPETVYNGQKWEQAVLVVEPWAGWPYDDLLLVIRASDSWAPKVGRPRAPRWHLWRLVCKVPGRAHLTGTFPGVWISGKLPGASMRHCLPHSGTRGNCRRKFADRI